MNLTEKTLKRNTVYEGRILRLNVDEVQLPDGAKSEREYIKHSGGAAVLLVKDGKVLLVRQYRYAYGKVLYEIPAGKLNAGEDAAVAAARELEEETGYRAELSHALDIFPTPGYTNEVIRIYFADKFEYKGSNPDDGKFLECEFIELEKVLQMIECGLICDAKTVAAVYKYCLGRK